MKKIQSFDSGQWKAFFRCSNDLCRAWFPYKVIETFYDEKALFVQRKRCKKCRNEILVRQVNNNSGGGFSAGGVNLNK